MAFEIVPAPHLPPYVCMACGCANQEPHVFIPHNQAWEQAWPFICRSCVAEMAGALGIVKTVTAPVEPVTVQPAPPSAALVVVDLGQQEDPAKTAIIAEAIAGAPNPDSNVVQCVCGATFDGTTAKAKLGSHKRNCEKAKEAAGNAG